MKQVPETTAKKSLVFVLGAGASKEVGLPVGSELRNLISESLDIRFTGLNQLTHGDYIIVKALQELYKVSTQENPSFPNAIKASWRIRDAMPQAISIDNFIDSHRDDEQIITCGKLSIVRCILEAESKSSLNLKENGGKLTLDFKKLQNTWYSHFFQLLTENCRKEDIEQRFGEISIISFNYDRCVEHFLHKSLQNYYGMTANSAAQALECLEIHHPYGKVGELPWEDQTTGIEFGSTPTALKLVNLAAHLRTFTEGIDPTTSDILAIRETVASAKRIAFLGFAFHPLNVELLLPKLPNAINMEECTIFATAVGVSNSDINSIKHKLTTLGNFAQSKLLFERDTPCSQLFVEYWRSLSLQS